MSKRGTSAKPCPGCKEMVWHETGGVCYACKRDLDHVIEMNQRVAKLRSDGTAATYRFSTVPHWNPGIYPGPDFKDHDDYRELLRNLVVAVATEVFPQDTADRDNRQAEELLDAERNPYDNSARDTLAINPTVANAIRALDKWCRQALPAAYNAGKGHGSKVLMQLASGNLTINDFDKAIEGKR